MGHIADIAGERFGKLIAIERAERGPNRELRWRCTCDCGRHTLASVGSLRSGNTASCGCQKIAALKISHGEQLKHGLCGTPVYNSWIAMKARCNNPNNSHYAYYGGRGIRISDSWNKSFEAFYTDMGPKPGQAYTLDRIDSNGNYEPSNCRWTTKSGQALNRRLRPENTSGISGVMQASNGRWHAEMTHNTEVILNRRFLTAEEAIVARKRAEEDVAFLESKEGKSMVEEMITSSTDDIPFD